MPTFTPAELEDVTVQALVRAGATDNESQVVGRHLVESNLAGHHSHGVMRVPQYAQEIAEGSIEPGREIQLVGEDGGVAIFDGQKQFGQTACYHSMKSAIERARSSGLGAASLRRANHSGRLGSYVTLASNEGMIGIVMAAGSSRNGQWVAPFGGRNGRLGTNPFSIGAPSAGDYPVVLDIATCMTPEGKVRDYLKRGEKLPEGWIVDSNGQPTTDPQALYDGGAVLPLGGTVGHKGFGLSFMIQVLSCALGGWRKPMLDQSADEVGHGNLLMVAIEVGRFFPIDDFRTSVSEIVEHVKSSEPAPGFDEVLVPGEWEHRQRAQQEADGISIPDTVWEEIQAVGGTGSN